MSSNVEGDKPKVITTRRSSLKCRQLVNKLDPDAIMKAKPKGKRNSVSWGLSHTFEFKAMKATFQDSKDINKEDNAEQKEKHDKFLATRKASIKNESSRLKEMLKKNAASIIEEENDDEAKANMKKNLQMGKDALKEVSESSESNKSKNSSKSESKSGSKSGSKSSSRSNSKSDSKSSSKSGSRSSSRSKSKSHSKSSSRHKNKSGKEKVKKSDKESENDTNKETEKIDIKKKRKVQMAEKTKEESDKDSQSNKETEKISIKKNRKIKIADKEDENENDKDSEKIVLKKNRKVKVEEEEDEKGNGQDSEKINIKKNRKIKISDDINEDNFEQKKAEVIDTIKENDTKVRLISLNEANNLNLDKIAYITLTDGTVAILKKEEEGNIQENQKINNKRLNLSNKPQINQNNMYEEEYTFQNNIYKDPNIPDQEVYYDNDNNNINNEPSGIGSAYNNYESQNINYYPTRSIPNINIIPDNQIPINVPYEAAPTLSIPPRIPNNIINYPQQYYINRSQYPINSHEPYETNLSYGSGLINNRRAISPLYYTNQNRQNRQYINNYNQQFPPPQNIRQNLSPNYKTIYQNYQKYSKNIYPSNNKNQNRNQNNLSNNNIPQIINLTQTQIPKEAIKFKVKVLEVIPVKLCDNSDINRHKSYNSSQLVYPFFNSQVMDPDLSPRTNQSHFQPQQRRLFHYSQGSTLNNNTNENRINSFEQELNVLNKQMTDSFNDFDNLEEEQEDYQNDELYKNCDLKYSELSLGQSGGKLKSKNMRRQNYMRPFVKPQINKRNVASEFRYVKAKPNAYNNQNIKESKGNSLKRK
jgi:hypothetical protein